MQAVGFLICMHSSGYNCPLLYRSTEVVTICHRMSLKLTIYTRIIKISLENKSRDNRCQLPSNFHNVIQMVIQPIQIVLQSYIILLVSFISLLFRYIQQVGYSFAFIQLVTMYMLLRGDISVEGKNVNGDITDFLEQVLKVSFVRQVEFIIYIYVCVISKHIQQVFYCYVVVGQNVLVIGKNNIFQYYTIQKQKCIYSDIQYFKNLDFWDKYVLFLVGIYISQTII
eukprot:TRINITY_DN156_c1_g1_i1.p3 TRINITY_DN156_c1_g1~~TRINITY_DN156_c1_g1_i1.p3  ORF type:complete len:226 (+),score=-8.48 TRINITY_DN156_c1_g1_i1:495-1172(+)